MSAVECGGCKGLGSHMKHCLKNPLYDYQLVLADRAEYLGDSIGANDTVSANYAYAIAGRLREQVKQRREEWEPLGENVLGHTMMGWYDHGDRGCMFHSRLNSWVFDADKRCLREHVSP